MYSLRNIRGKLWNQVLLLFGEDIKLQIASYTGFNTSIDTGILQVVRSQLQASPALRGFLNTLYLFIDIVWENKSQTLMQGGKAARRHTRRIQLMRTARAFV